MSDDTIGLSEYQRGLITGDLVEGLADEVMFPVLKDQTMRMAAFKMYMLSADAIQIAQELGIDKIYVQKWIATGKWSARLREERKSRAEEEQIALDLFRQINRLQEAQDQLKAGRTGREMVMAYLANPVDKDGNPCTPGPDQLKKLGEALVAFGNVAARAVGIGETVESKGADREEQTKRSAPCAVVIVNNGPPASAPGRTIEIKESRQT